MKNKLLHLKIFYLYLLIIFAGFSNNLLSQSIQIDSTFASDTEIFPFSVNDTIYGLKLSGNVQLNSDTSLVRVILSDTNGTEYMIYESYPLIVDEDTISLDEVCDETCYLDNFIPYSVRFEIINAEIYIDSFICSINSVNNPLILQNEEKIVNDSIKLEKIKSNIPEYDLNWIAGDNNVIHYFYKDKKNIFGEKYNLCGYEYYKDGIFSLPEQESPAIFQSAYVKNFNWRNRHGANKQGSPYFDNDDTTYTGWLTSVKDQGSSPSCWAFSSIAPVEAVTNLYFNQHIDYDLSEQDIVINSGGGVMNDPEVALNYISTNGVVTEFCFPFNTGTKCINPDTIIKINSSTVINLPSGNQNRAIDTLKKALITKGPLSFTIPSLTHAVTLTGFSTNQNDEVYWIYKDSQGADFGDNGFVYTYLNPLEDNRPIAANNPVEVLADSTPEILCRDEDGDSYYFWGIGPKPIGCPTCPDVQDCDDSNPNLGPYGTDYSCDCLLSYSSDTLFITSDTTWATNINQERVIVISNGAELTITGQLAFVENARLIIKQGGKLIIDGGILTKACTENWRGVEVWGNPDTTQGFTSLQGYLVLKNSGKIEFAQTAVFTGKKSYSGNIIDGYEGGLVQARDAIFLNNIIDVEFRPYQNMHPYYPEKELKNLSGFRNCEFLTDFSNNEFTDLEAHVILRDVKDICFYGCDFIYSDSYFNYSDDNGTGILSYDASFFVNPRCTNPNVQPCTAYDSCRFENLKYGIRAFNNGAYKFVSIKDAVFTSNERGIYFSGLTGPEIVSSKFYCNEDLPGVSGKDLGDIVYGLYLDGCTGYHIENNEFYEKYQYGGCQVSRVGLFVCNCECLNNVDRFNFLFHSLCF